MMMEDLKQCKAAIRAFLPNFTTPRLCELLAHMQEGRFDFYSCCCYVGAATSDHALSSAAFTNSPQHYELALSMEGGRAAMEAVAALSTIFCGHVPHFSNKERDKIRSRILIPIVKAELRRRARNTNKNSNLEVPTYVNSY